MLVQIEHYARDTLLTGKVLTIGQLKYRVMQVLRDTERADFVSVFCTRYNFEILKDDPSARVDYRIDLDGKVPLIYTPVYESP